MRVPRPAPRAPHLPILLAWIAACGSSGSPPPGFDTEGALVAVQSVAGSPTIAAVDDGAYAGTRVEIPADALPPGAQIALFAEPTLPWSAASSYPLGPAVRIALSEPLAEGAEASVRLPWEREPDNRFGSFGPQLGVVYRHRLGYYTAEFQFVDYDRDTVTASLELPGAFQIFQHNVDLPPAVDLALRQPHADVLAFAPFLMPLPDAFEARSLDAVRDGDAMRVLACGVTGNLVAAAAAYRMTPDSVEGPDLYGVGSGEFGETQGEMRAVRHISITGAPLFRLAAGTLIRTGAPFTLDEAYQFRLQDPSVIQAVARGMTVAPRGVTLRAMDALGNTYGTTDDPDIDYGRGWIFRMSWSGAVELIAQPDELRFLTYDCDLLGACLYGKSDAATPALLVTATPRRLELPVPAPHNSGWIRGGPERTGAGSLPERVVGTVSQALGCIWRRDGESETYIPEVMEASYYFDTDAGISVGQRVHTDATGEMPIDEFLEARGIDVSGWSAFAEAICVQRVEGTNLVLLAGRGWSATGKPQGFLAGVAIP